MNCLIWNIRGLRGSESQQRLHAFVKEKQIKVLAVLEPMIDLDPRFMTRRLGFSGVISNLSGHIWVFFAADVRAECVFDHAQFLHIRVSASFLPTEIFCSFVYARCDYVQRRDLWASLLLVKPVLGPWLVGGDFNVVRDASECLGSRGGRFLPMEEFNTFILDSGLIDAGFEGSSFTWTNKTIWKRLDRVLVSVDWGDHFSSIRVEHLARTVSDHCPLLVTAPVFARGPSSFRFQRMWVRHHGFLQTVRLNWNLPCSLSGMPRLFAKMKRLKHHLRWWNRDVFGNIFDRLTEAERAVRSAEDVCEADPSDANWTSLSDRNEDLARITAMEADFWKPKAACHWLEDGERNTRLFHNMVRKKRVTNKIFRIWENGVCLTSQDLIQQSGALFFQDLLTGEPSALDCPDFSGFSSVISVVENDGIAAIPSLEEVRATVFSIHPDSVAGPDGFSSAFFQHCWEIVHQDVFGAVLDFFQGSPMPQGFTATTITLIPKVEGARAWSDFRPISLCNVTNKIISKLLYSRLRDVVERLVSPNQSGFVPGRMISDNILLAQELTHSITLPTRGGNVILKLDMAKAYDRVQACRGFGFRLYFPLSFLREHQWFAIGVFGSTRGLRQGDPLSPLLFVLGAEYLSRGLDRIYLQHPALRYRSDCDILISHLAYADDIIIFANGGSRGMQRLVDFLHHYENCSGQRVNAAKSSLILPPRCSGRLRSRLLRITGFAEGHLPLKYLGVPLLSGWFSHLWLSWRSLSGPSTPSSGGRAPWKGSGTGLDFGRAPLYGRNSFSGSIAGWMLLPVPPPVLLFPPFGVVSSGSALARSLAFAGELVSEMFPFGMTLGLGTFLCPPGVWSAGGRDARVSHFLSEGSWDFDRLCAVVSPSVAEEIVLIPVLSGDPDLARWIHSSDGAFSVRSAWELIRQRAPSSDIFRPCWGSWLRPTMSFFLWRFWHQWLPVDECVEERFGLVPGGHVREFLPCIVLWFLWTARNDAKHRHLPISGETVKFQILSYLRLAHFARTVKPRHWLGVFHVARLPGISVALHRFHRTAIVRWLRPPSGCFKLNVDGSSRGTSGDSSAGGVVRDDSGRFVLSFSEFIGAGSSLRAELWAVWRGLLLCSDHSFFHLWIELDSLTSIQLIRSRRCCWGLDHIVSRILVLLLRGFLFPLVLPVWCEWAQTLAHYMFGLLGIGWALALTLLVLFFGPLIFPGALFLFGPLFGPLLVPGGRLLQFLLARRLSSFTGVYWMSWWFQGFFPDDPLHCYNTFVRSILQMLDLFCSSWIAIFILLFYRHCTVISWPYLILTAGIHTVTRFQIRVVLTYWIIQGDGLETRISSWILHSSPSYHLVFFGVLTLSAARI
ncbi:uncharacterized protein [Primulina eburnea]|uniref:uncharacterized protein n=1 Tax=Primulina eburnea TaxID=1245227 RepID=UPI003C6C57FF